jgi:DNA-binding IclR family transcriptional regulator
VQLYIRDGDARVCVESIESPHELRTIVPVGARLPLTAGSAGHVLTEPGDGWVASVGEREPGVASVSAPVRAGGRVVAAVSVSGPIERTTRRPGARYGDAVLAAARRAEVALG